MEVQWILKGHPLTVLGEGPLPHLGLVQEAEDVDLRRQPTDLAATSPTNGFSSQPYEEDTAPGPPVEHRITMVQTGASSWRIFADRR